MTHEATQILINRLVDLLEKERAALLDGDLETISKLLGTKEALIDALNDMPAAAPDGLRGLQAKVARNQALLDGALQGIRKVAARMAAFRKIRRTLETYDESGRKKTIPGDVAHQVEKRA